MRFTSFFLLAAIAGALSAFDVRSEQISVEGTWPSDQRLELSDKQISMGLRLAGSKMSGLFDEGKCKLGTRDDFGYCVIGKYRFVEEGRFSAIGYLQSARDPDVYSPVIIVQSSLTYLKADLEPTQARAISVDFAETILDRKLNDIDVEDPDTFYDPRDLDLMHLFYRASGKAGRSVDRESCGDEDLALFKEGKPTPCAFGSFYVEKRDENRYALLTMNGHAAVMSGYFGGGHFLMDATLSDATKINLAIDFIEATLGVERENVTGIPRRVNDVAVDSRFASVSKKIVDFAAGRSCGESAHSEYLGGASTDCEVAGYFLERTADADFVVHYRPEPNATSVAFYIMDGKPLMRLSDLADNPYHETSKVIPELAEAFAKLQ